MNVLRLVMSVLKEYPKCGSVEDVHIIIEELMGEYISAKRDWRLSDSQRDYYDAKLDALYELNRRIL